MCYVFSDKYGTYGHFGIIGGIKLKSHDLGDLVSSELHHNTLVRPKECMEAILAQVDQEIVGIKECDHHQEDGIEVQHLCTSTFLYIGRDRHL
jgi:hypothetical protein